MKRAMNMVVGLGVATLLVLLWANAYTDWIKQNGGLASWIQALGSLYAIVAVSLPVFLERQLAVKRARRTVAAAAGLATDLMNTVAQRSFDETASFSEWWVPQWHVIEEVCASCPVHEMDCPTAMEAFVTIRELYGRLRAWAETGADTEPPMQSYVGNLCLNANEQKRQLLKALAAE